MKKLKTKKVIDKPWKSTQVELNQRITEFQTLILNGYTRSHLLQHAAEKWKVSVRMADEYLARAYALIKEANSLTMEENMSIITTNLWHQLRVARKTQDNAECRQILMALAKLQGLDQQTIHHKFDLDEEFDSMSDEELDKELSSDDAT